MQRDCNECACGENQLKSGRTHWYGMAKSDKRDNVHWYHGVPCPPVFPVEFVPDIECVVSIIGQQIWMNNGVGINDCSEESHGEQNAIPSRSQCSYRRFAMCEHDWWRKKQEKESEIEHLWYMDGCFVCTLIANHNRPIYNHKCNKWHNHQNVADQIHKQKTNLLWHQVKSLAIESKYIKNVLWIAQG